MRRTAFLLIVLLVRAQTAYSDAQSIGPNGINSSGLMLDGDGIGIGQVETRRPGDTNFDTNPTPVDFTHNAINPAQVFIRHPDNVTFTATPNDINEASLHALEMAGVMISTEAVTKGVSPAADLYSVGIAATGPTAEDVYAQSAISANHLATLATQDIWAINMSFAVSADGLDADGTSTLSSFIDWSARVHNVLYTVAGFEFIQMPGGPVPNPGPLPADNFNGITVIFSKKNGAKYREVDPDNIFTADDFWQGNGDFTHPDIMAPGRDLQFATAGSMTTTVPDMIRNGTSAATTHVTGTAALLHEHAINKGWGANARRHEVIKAVIMNSADKIEQGSITTHNGLAIPTGGLLGMERTAIDTNGDDWFDSEADDDTADFGAPRNGGFIPLDDQMGVGHLNANRAFKQYDAGEFNDSNTVDVPVMGWDYGFTSGEDDINRYRFNEPLAGGSFVSITLAWDRVVNFDTNEGTAGYDVGDTFVDYKDTDAPGDLPSDSQINDLDIYFQERGAPTIFSALAMSLSPQGNLEHLFFQVPADGDYEFWVVQHDEDIGGVQNYGVAWWTAGVPQQVSGDFDSDGDVDGRDFLAWQRGNSPNFLSADDLADWQGNYGVGPLSAATAVPEPSCLVLLITLVFLRRNR